MPTIISHAVVGVTSATLAKNLRASGVPKFILLSVLCSVLPDADVITFKFGIEYGSFWGHRGFFHSIFFALIIGFSVKVFCYRSYKFFSKDGFMLFAYFSLVSMSHDLLDILTNGGLGIALLSPFNNTRYFFLMTPIEVVAINPVKFFSAHGLKVMSNEVLWVWFPCLILVFFSMFIQKWRER